MFLIVARIIPAVGGDPFRATFLQTVGPASMGQMVAGTAVPCRYGADHPKLVRLDLNQPAIPQLPAAG